MRFVRGVAPIKCFRWVGEMTVYGKRYRCRSTNLGNVKSWLIDMRNKYGNI